MDPERSRIQSDLRGLLAGEVLCDDFTRQLYASDGSIHQILPLGVVRPASTDDVAAVVKYAAENHIPIHPRGAGSNQVGAAVGPGLVIDFSYAMRRVLDCDDEQVRVQPGIVLATLNRQLAERGRHVGPDPASRSVTTIGGMVAVNASGSHWLAYGSPRDHVLSMQLVLASGEVVQVTSPLNNGMSGAATDPGGTVGGLARWIGADIASHADLIERYWPKTLINNAGYDLRSVLSGDRADLVRLMCGSEGTLAVITELALRLAPVPRFRGAMLMFSSRLHDAAQVALELAGEGMVACDLLDRRLLSIARESDERFARVVPPDAEAVILVEMQSDDLLSVSGALKRLGDRMVRRRLVTDFRITTDVSERNLYWRLVRRAIPRLYSLKGRRRALPFVDDIAVPPKDLPAVLMEVHGVLNQHEITAGIFAHIGQGQLQVYPFLDLSDAADVARLEKLASDLFPRVIDAGGTISGGHGDGRSRTEFLRRQYGPLVDVFERIKQQCDPRNLLNPGLIVGPDSPRLVGQIRPASLAPGLEESAAEPEPRPLAAAAENEVAAGPTSAVPVGNGSPAAREASDPPKPLVPQLQWDLSSMLLTARNCNGCGRCRTTSPDERMCPIFRLAPREEASPRAKANLLRGILTGQLDQASFSRDELKAIADLCVNCHQCRLECPASVDIPKLMMEAKGQYVAVNGLRMSEWLLTRLDVLYKWAGRAPWVANFLERNRTSRWMLERLFGIAHARKLPRFSRRPFLRWAARQRLTQPSRRTGRKVLYFVDAFVNWNDVELGQAAVAVLQHNGFEVYVPPAQTISGMSLISAGALERARQVAARNVETLAEAVRAGYEVVTTEPSAALALSHEYLHLSDDADTRLVAEHTHDITSWLWKLHELGQLHLKFHPLSATVGYHLPCHLRALGDDAAAVKLLRLIPALRVERIERGCSGMAGTYGLMSANYRTSLRVGRGLIAALRSPVLDVGATECSTCKIQMEQGTVKGTAHPIKILALAYGLMPELNDLFSRRSGDLVIS